MSTTTAFLSRAVHHNRASSREGLLERLFTVWFRGFVYNQIWEDPRVDAEALRLGSGDRVIAISSGGCNILNYLQHEPAQIVAIDINASHLALTRLKLTALRHLPSYDDFFAFFGLGKDTRNLDNCEKYLRNNLDSSTREFWEKSTWIGRTFGPRRIEYFSKGFYNYAKLGLLLRMLHFSAKITRRDPVRLLEARTIEEQEQFFEEVCAPIFENPLMRVFGRSPLTTFSLGIPPRQFKVMKREMGNEIISVFRDRVRRLTCGFPIQDNYFAWQAFGRRYDISERKAVPDYLRQDNYEALRDRVDRVDTQLTSLIDYLREQPDRSFNRFVLLDSQDWMPPQVINELWTEIARVGGPGSRIVFRTAGEQSPVEAALEPEVRNRFDYEQELSRELHERDRSAIYGMFHVYSLQN